MSRLDTLADAVNMDEKQENKYNENVCACMYVCDDCRKIFHDPIIVKKPLIVPPTIKTKGYYHYLLMNSTILLKELKHIIQMQRGLLH